MRQTLTNLRYVLRQLRQSPVFTVAAVLTLALGIGGTTAIFTLIHAVMLRSLPVADPGAAVPHRRRDDCCVEGGPQDRWGMYSYPLYERLKAETPEFEQVAAFQAGGARLSVRREGVDSAARPLRSEYVTGNYFSTLGVGAFGGRVLTPADDKPSRTPVAVMSHHTWQSDIRRRPVSRGRDASCVEGHPFTIVGVAPAGILWRNARERSSRSLDPGSAGAADRRRRHRCCASRCRRGFASSAGCGRAPRSTAWRRVSPACCGSGCSTIPAIPRTGCPTSSACCPKQVINVVPAGAGRRRDEGGVRAQPADPARRSAASCC